MCLELVVREVLGVDVDVGQQHEANVLLLDLEELEELGHHVPSIEGHGEQALLDALSAAGIYHQGIRNKGSDITIARGLQRDGQPLFPVH